MANGSGIVWQQSPAQMAQRTDRYKTALLSAVFALATEWAAKIAADAKAHHGWTNRTGAAEAGLFGRAFRTAVGAVLIVGHGVEYGVHLERRFGGRYSAVLPALQRAYAAVMSSLQRLVS